MINKFTAFLLTLILLLAPVTAFAAGELGAEDNPYVIGVSGIDVLPTRFLVAPGQTVWTKALNGNATLTIGYATGSNYKVEYNGRTYYPDADNTLHFYIAKANDTFKVINTSDSANVNVYMLLTEGEYVDPTGTIDKPEEVTLAPNIFGAIGATVTKDLDANNKGYHFMTTAQSDGIMSVSVSAFDNMEDFNAMGWSYSVSNKTKGISGGIHYSDEEEPVYHEEIEVSEGDEVIVAVATYDPESPNSNPEGVVSVQFSFAPIGSFDCPEKVEAGTHETALEANNEGYYYSWTATEDCSATVGIDTETTPEWQYSVNVLRADGNNSYGDTHWCDDEEVVSSETHELKAGDTLRIWIATYNGTFRNPKGTVAWYVETEEISDIVYGDVDGDGDVYLRDVLILRKWIAGIINGGISIEKADVDGNDRVTISDVLLIRKYLAGIITEFPAEQ